jgi:hypothetical protein
MSASSYISSPLRRPSGHDKSDESQTLPSGDRGLSASPPAYTSRRNSEIHSSQPPPYERRADEEDLQMSGKTVKARRSSVRYVDQDFLNNETWGPELRLAGSEIEPLQSKSSRRSKRPRKIKQDSYYNSDDDFDSDNEGLNAVRNRIRSPRMRRAILGGLVLFGLLWVANNLYNAPAKREFARIEQSILVGPKGDFSAHMKPEFTDLVLVRDLDSKHVPNSAKGRQKHHPGRLVFVGDVHGMKKELEKLLRKINFNQERDHLILTGDMISKGYDSVGVVELAMKLGASGIRGNHEDKVLLAVKSAQGNIKLAPPKIAQSSEIETESGAMPRSDEELSEIETFSHRKEYESRILGMSFSEEQRAWLQSCPVILRIGQIEGMGEVVAVHAGLVPGLKLQHQDPWFVMNMRSIDLDTWVPSDGRNGTTWTKVCFPPLPHQKS